MQKAIRKGLLPCPHCGGKAGLWQAYDSSWCVQCDRCGAMTMKFDKDEAVKRWNKRVKDKRDSVNSFAQILKSPCSG